MSAASEKAGRSLKTALGLEAGEERLFGTLFVQNFFTGLAVAFFFVAATSRFVRQVSIQDFPLAYTISGGIGFLLLNFYKRMLVRRGAPPVFGAVLIVHALLAAGFFAAFRAGGPAALMTALSYAAFVLAIPFTTMFALSFSSLCLSVYNIAQSKRLSPTVSTGETIASILAYICAPVCMRLAGEDAVLPLSACTALLAVLPLRRLRKLAVVAPAPPSVAGSLPVLLKNRFNGALTVFTFFSIVAILLTDYTYLVSVRLLPEINGMTVPELVADIFVCIKLSDLVLSAFSRMILRQQGMKKALLMLPFAMLAAAAFGVLTGFVFTEKYFFILFLVLNKVFDRVIRKAITVPGVRVLYQLAKPGERVRLQSLLEGPVSQVFTCIAGALLLIIAHYSKARDSFVFLRLGTVTGLVVYLLWFFSTLRLFEAYKAGIQKFLQKPGKEPSTGTVSAGASPLVVAESSDAASPDWNAILGVESGLLERAGPAEALRLIAFYNGGTDLEALVGKGEVLLPRLQRLYFRNDNYFSRLLIIRYVHAQQPEHFLAFTRSIHDLSAFLLRVELIGRLRVPGIGSREEDRFFVYDLCEACAGELVWCESALADLEGCDEFSVAGNIRDHRSELRQMLFALLGLLYEAGKIDAIAGILLDENCSTESQLFAMELLDAILDKSLKLPVLTAVDKLPITVKAAALGDRIVTTKMSPAGRVLEILMKDFLLIDACTKELALEDYYRLTGDTDVLKAFASGPVGNLARRAKQLAGEALEAPPAEAEALLRGLKPARRAMLLRYGIQELKGAGRLLPAAAFNPSMHSAVVGAGSGNPVTVDTLGLALLFRE